MNTGKQVASLTDVTLGLLISEAELSEEIQGMQTRIQEYRRRYERMNVDELMREVEKNIQDSLKIKTACSDEIGSLKRMSDLEADPLVRRLHELQINYMLRRAKLSMTLIQAYSADIEDILQERLQLP